MAEQRRRASIQHLGIAEIQAVEKAVVTTATLFTHRPQRRDSLFANPEQLKFSHGTFNFLALLVMLFTAHTITEHYASTGELVDWTLSKYILQGLDLGLAVWAGLAIWSMTVWALRLAIHTFTLSERRASLVYVFVQLVVLVVPIWLVQTSNCSPIMRGGIIMQTLVHFMKIHSYWHSNYLLEKLYRKRTPKDEGQPPIAGNDGEVVEYPDNLSFSNFLNFLVVPTLTYEASFPKATTIRWSAVVKHACGAAVCLFITYIIVDMYMQPVFYASLNIHPVRAVLRLAVPSMAMWCLLFFGVFHCMLNLFAELTKFADRQFYTDWWNATTWDEWWKRWNRPVHEWMLRHIYHSSLRTITRSKNTAMFLTFLTSAVLHEIILSLAFQMFRPYLTLVMLLHILLIFVTRHQWFSPALGNAFVWLCLFVGQPLVELLYAREWVANHMAA